MEDSRRLDYFQIISLALSILTALLIVATPPTRNYEMTIYSAFPSYFWLALLMSLVIAQLGCILASINTSKVPIKWWVVMAIPYLQLLAIPSTRGYYLYGRGLADVLSHLGYTRTILASGHVWEFDWYPTLHVLLSQLSLLGVPLLRTPQLINFAEWTIYLLGLFLLTREYFDSSAGSIAVACGIPFLFGKFHLSTHTSFFAFAFLPLYFYSIERMEARSSFEWASISILMTLFLITAHPVNAVLGLLYLFGKTISNNKLFSRDGFFTLNAPTWPLNFILLFTVLFATWEVLVHIRAIYLVQDVLTMIGKGGDTIAARKASQLSSARSLRQILIGFVKSYGSAFLYCCISGVYLLYVRTRRSSSAYSHILTQYSLGALFGAAILLFPLVVSNPIRGTRYLLLFATVGLAAFLRTVTKHIDPLELIRPSRNPSIKRSSLILVFSCLLLPIAATGLTIGNIYVDNYHLSHSENKGDTWVVDYHSPDSQTFSLYTTSKTQYLIQGVGTESKIFYKGGPDEFPNQLKVSQSENSTYLVTKEFDSQYYRVLVPYLQNDYQRYNSTDVERIRANSTYQRVYSNSNYTVWKI